MHPLFTYIPPHFHVRGPTGPALPLRGRWKVSLGVGPVTYLEEFPRSLPHLGIFGVKMIGTRTQSAKC